MAITLYEIVAAGDARISNNCWRTRMALAHKGLAYETRACRHVDIARICDSRRKGLPVIEDGACVIEDSWRIAEHLECAYAHGASLFDGEAGRAFALFVHVWLRPAVHLPAVQMLAGDLHDRLLPEDRAYFRSRQEARFGRTLEEMQADREGRIDAWRELLEPLRACVLDRPFLGGERPLYVDYVVFGTFQWARMISPFRLLADGDPLAAWFERCLDLFAGTGRAVDAFY
ncbi:MAG: glutathione S-transferase N-terminal domain-containing protein [Rhodospirillales bacterium]|nr:glutathione S-transferase N-terminal domain-containing protein [Rhodospirillales bacterium]